MPVYKAAQYHIALRDNAGERALFRHYQAAGVLLAHHPRSVRDAGGKVNHRYLIRHHIRGVHRQSLRYPSVPSRLRFRIAFGLHSTL